MNIIRHIVATRIPNLIIVTACGFEFPDFGIPVNHWFDVPIPDHIAIVTSQELKYSDQVNECLACNLGES